MSFDIYKNDLHVVVCSFKGPVNFTYFLVKNVKFYAVHAITLKALGPFNLCNSSGISYTTQNSIYNIRILTILTLLRDKDYS